MSYNKTVNNTNNYGNTINNYYLTPQNHSESNKLVTEDLEKDELKKLIENLFFDKIDINNLDFNKYSILDIISEIYSYNSQNLNFKELISRKQNILCGILIYYEKKINSQIFNDTISFSIVHINNQIRYLVDKFEKENDIDQINTYSDLFAENINLSYYLIKQSINNLSLGYQFYDQYIIDQINSFAKTMQLYHDDPYNYNKDYYNLDFEKKCIIDKKCEIIANINDKITQKLTNLGFRLITLRKQNLITEKLNSFIFKIFEQNGGNIYLYPEFEPLDTSNEFNRNGIFTSSQYNDDRLENIFIYLFNLNHHNNLKLLENKCKSQILIQELLKFADNGKNKFDAIKKIIDIDEVKYNNYLQIIKEFLNSNLKHLQVEIEKKIINTKISDNEKLKFNSDILDKYNIYHGFKKMIQDNGKLNLKLNELPNDLQKDGFFGFHTLFDKSYFFDDYIDEFAWVKSLGADYGHQLGLGEDLEIIKNITSTTHLDTKIITADNIIQTLNLISDKYNMIVIDTNLMNHIYKLRDLFEFSIRSHNTSLIGYFRYENKKVPIYVLSDIKCILGIDLNKINITQYKPYTKSNESDWLYVEVSELDEKDITQLKEKMKKDNFDPKTKVKITIAEKFRVYLEENAIYGFKII